MRLSALDHLRGAGILLVFLFSFWTWLYPNAPAPDAIVHNVPGQLHAGDLVFALFIFCSGVSLWFFYRRCLLRKLQFDSAAGRYLRLLGLAILISAVRLFTPFPDEVIFIALSALLVLPLLWLRRPLIPAVYAALVLAVLVGLRPLAPELWYSLTAPYLGGILGVFYYSLLALAACAVAAFAFPSGLLDKRSLPALWKSWGLALALLAASSLVLGAPDKMGLSISFLALSLAVFIPLLALSIHLFDNLRWRLPLVVRIGASSLAGWAAFYAVSALFWYRGWGGSLDSGLYPLFCVLLFAALGLLLHCLDIVRERQKPPAAAHARI